MPEPATTAAIDILRAREAERERVAALCTPTCEIHDGGCCTCGGRGDPCPECDGKGGAMSGYYEPEWSDCECCDGAGRATAERVAAYKQERREADDRLEAQARREGWL